MAYPSKLSTPAIIDAALSILDTQGRDSLGMRALAESLSVRPASLYKHVGDLATLEAMIAEQVAESLRSSIEAAVARRKDVARGARDDLRTAADAYLSFARTSPARYSMLVAPYAAGHLDARKALWNQLLQLVGDCTAKVDDTAGAVAVWAFLHGYVVLEQSGMFGASGPHDGFERGMTALAAAL